ncbi:MAG: F0F1 ATP synthase subunit B' [Cyanobacteria bacterium]|nr:F0F1 ATP synthase subunit B' [Cyanobacteriota bacterium]
MLHSVLPNLLAAEGGGLFDLDATLPLMAVQFLVLALLLNATLYKPLGAALDERADYIRNTQAEAKETLATVENLTREYEVALADARRAAQTTIADAQADAQSIAAAAIAEAQQQARAERERAQLEIDRQKQTAMAALDAQVDGLSRQIVKKLLGYELG